MDDGIQRSCVLVTRVPELLEHATTLTGLLARERLAAWTTGCVNDWLRERLAAFGQQPA